MPAPGHSDIYRRSGLGIVVPDCLSIAIDRVHRLGGFLLVSLSKMPRGHRSTAPRARHPGAFPIKANDHPDFKTLLCRFGLGLNGDVALPIRPYRREAICNNP